MRRREFILSLGSAAAACPLTTHAQQQLRPIPRIGLLLANEGPARSSILRSLAERGYIDGKTAKIEQRHGEGQLERLPGLARELAAMPVDVIVSVAASATVAARQASATIPIVMVHAGDPIGYGLVESLARPGGNVTGTTSYAPELVGKGIALLRELIPGILHVALLAVPSNAGTPLAINQAVLAASSLGIELTLVGVERAGDLDAAFSTIDGAKADSVFVFVEPMLYTNRARLFEFAARKRLPTMYQNGDVVRDGGLIGYSPVFRAHDPLAADYVDKILKGEKPADLPVVQSTTFELVINLKTAKELGVTVPPSILARADEVIE